MRHKRLICVRSNGESITGRVDQNELRRIFLDRPRPRPNTDRDIGSGVTRILPIRRGSGTQVVPAPGNRRRRSGAGEGIGQSLGWRRPGQPLSHERCCRTGSFTRQGRPNRVSLCIVQFRDRRGSQGWSCAPGWPGPATGRHQRLAGADQLPGSPDRLRCGPGAHRGGRRVRAAGARPQHPGRFQHGARRDTQRCGRHGSTVGRGAGLFAAAARDRGPVSLPGDAGPGRPGPGCEPRRVCDEPLPDCGRVPARLPGTGMGMGMAGILTAEPPKRRVPRTGPQAPCRASPRAGTGGAISERTVRRRAARRLRAGRAGGCPRPAARCSRPGG